MGWWGNLALIGAFCTVVSITSDAEAKRRFIFNWGEDIFEVGEFPVEMGGAEGVKAGFKCQIVGLFGACFHWWDCEPVAYQGDSYDDSPQLASYVRGHFKVSDVRLGLWQKHGRWLFAGGLLLFIGLAIFAAIDQSDKDYTTRYDASSEDEEDA